MCNVSHGVYVVMVCVSVMVSVSVHLSVSAFISLSLRACLNACRGGRVYCLTSIIFSHIVPIFSCLVPTCRGGRVYCLTSIIFSHIVPITCFIHTSHLARPLSPASGVS